MHVSLIAASQYFSAGLCMGLGAIGAGVGEGFIAGSAAKGISRQPAMAGEILKMMLIGQAVTETPSIFALVISILLIFKSYSGSGVIEFSALISAGFCMGAGAVGCGVGCGFPGAAACEAISRNPRISNKIMRIMLIGQAVSQSTSIYAMVVALVLLFVIK